MDIRGHTEISLIDYPGKISTIIFTYGCNLRCSWCHSPSLVTKSKLRLKKYSLKNIMDYVREKNKYQKWIDAIVICGGEPTIQKDLFDMLVQIRTKLPGILIKLDTNGTYPSIIRKLLHYKLLDYVAMDVKVDQLGREKYLQSISILKESNIDYEFRMTCFPDQINDDNIEKILFWISLAIFFTYII
jgi:pyruvate formate lyase activating enzyme